MISFNQFLTLWLLFIGYLFLGAFIFYATERKHEEAKRIEERIENMEVEDILLKYFPPASNKVYRQLAFKLKKRCNITCNTVFSPIDLRRLEQVVEEEVEEEFQWTFYNSFFFALTTLSTIGYGNLHPTSSLGRILVIIYSLVGIPLNGIVLTQLGEFFASTFLKVHQRYKGKRFETRFVLVVDIITYLVPGVLVFIFLPSGLFVYFEGWTFDESIYFAFVTLTTIGYGDYVAGQTTKDKRWYGVYKVVLLIWIMFGLGYLVMILGFISRAMRCKKMARLEQKLAQNIKQTQNKIWNGFAKDVTYVRRMLNEMYLLKFKPVYHDEDSMLYIKRLRNRSQSLPDLTLWNSARIQITDPLLIGRGRVSRMEDDVIDEEEMRIQFEKYKMNRRKGLSQNLFKKEDNLRVRSEADLTKIDRVATFGNATQVEPQELLARVVDVLGTTYGLDSTSTSEPSDDDENQRTPIKKLSQFEKELNGIHGFSNEEILRSEWYPSPPAKRSSWIGFEAEKPEYEGPPSYSEQWTWPGDGSHLENAKIKSSTSPSVSRTHLSPVDTHATSKGSGIIQVPAVHKLRRMSTAAINFLMKSTSPSSKEADDVESNVKKRRLNSVSTGPKQMAHCYSLCDDIDNEVIKQYIDYYMRTTKSKQQGNAVKFLQEHLQQLDSSNDRSAISPILRQTTIGDFIQVLNSLKYAGVKDATVSGAETSERKAKSSPSPLFSLFQQSQDVDQSKRRSISCTLPNELADRSAVPIIEPARNSIRPPDQFRQRRYSLYSAPRNYTTMNLLNSASLTKRDYRRYSQSQQLHVTENDDNDLPQQPIIRKLATPVRANAMLGDQAGNVTTVPNIIVTPPPSMSNESSQQHSYPNSHRWKIRRFSIRPASLMNSRKNSLASANNLSTNQQG